MATPTTMGAREQPAKSAETSAASSETRREIWSSLHRIVLMWECMVVFIRKGLWDALQLLLGFLRFSTVSSFYLEKVRYFFKHSFLLFIRSD